MDDVFNEEKLMTALKIDGKTIGIQGQQEDKINNSGQVKS